ncbi:MAG TPA: hypothetical protein VF786_06100 [Terriglobales bacterium]
MRTAMQLMPKKWKQSFKQLGLMTRYCANARCGRGFLTASSVLRRSESYLLNRTEWFCSPRCLESELACRFERVRSTGASAVSPTRMPLGLILLGRGLFEDEQLRDAIALQQRTGQRIGACLCSTGAATEQDILSGLSAQWASPVFPAHRIQKGCSSLIPAALLREHAMLPVHFTAASRNLYVAFAQGVDYAALYAIEQMLDCHTEACVVPDRVIFDEIEKRSLTCENERALRYPESAAETARIIVAYAKQCGAENVRYVSTGKDLWVRVVGEDGFMDITFHKAQP